MEEWKNGRRDEAEDEETLPKRKKIPIFQLKIINLAFRDVKRCERGKKKKRSSSSSFI